MHILTHDFAGHPFQIQLSRALASRGHRVTHAYCSSLRTTPQADLTPAPSDPPGLQIVPLDLREPLAKYNLVRRWRQERRYGAMAADLVRRVTPDVVLSANTPLDAQATLYSASRLSGACFVFWLQDLIGVATDRHLRGSVPLIGGLIGRHYLAMEARTLRNSDAVVAITEAFRKVLNDWGVRDSAITTIENWAPIDAIPQKPHDNEWALEKGLSGRFVFLYTGTMGLKHNPELLARLAESMLDRPEVRVVVVSQGPGAEYLRRQQAARGLSNLIVQGYEPFDRLPDVMGAAQVLVAVLEPDAGAFSVPSKVLTYLCAGRPMLAAMPLENLASRIVAREGAGVVVEPNDIEGFVAGARSLMDDADARNRMGAAARAYAETAFDIERITDRFEDVLFTALGRGR